jgi:hypothetical protein
LLGCAAYGAAVADDGVDADEAGSGAAAKIGPVGPGDGRRPVNGGEGCGRGAAFGAGAAGNEAGGAVVNAAAGLAGTVDGSGVGTAAGAGDDAGSEAGAGDGAGPSRGRACSGDDSWPRVLMMAAVTSRASSAEEVAVAMGACTGARATAPNAAAGVRREPLSRADMATDPPAAGAPTLRRDPSREWRTMAGDAAGPPLPASAAQGGGGAAEPPNSLLAAVR